MEGILIISGIVSVLLVVFSVYWMLKMLTLTKQSRIIHSMTLITILKYCQSKGVAVDIEKIQKEVEKSVG